MAYIVQLHNAIYSQTAVQYLRRISRIIDRNKPVILVAHQFAGDSIASFNATVRQLKVIWKIRHAKLHLAIHVIVNSGSPHHQWSLSLWPGTWPEPLWFQGQWTSSSDWQIWKWLLKFLWGHHSKVMKRIGPGFALYNPDNSAVSFLISNIVRLNGWECKGIAYLQP